MQGRNKIISLFKTSSYCLNFYSYKIQDQKQIVNLPVEFCRRPVTVWRGSGATVYKPVVLIGMLHIDCFYKNPPLSNYGSVPGGGIAKASRISVRLVLPWRGTPYGVRECFALTRDPAWVRCSRSASD